MTAGTARAVDPAPVPTGPTGVLRTHLRFDTAIPTLHAQIRHPVRLQHIIATAFPGDARSAAAGRRLWRRDGDELTIISTQPGQWSRLNDHVPRCVEVLAVTALDLPETGATVAFRLRSAPSRCVRARDGSRGAHVALTDVGEQHAWLAAKGVHHGFTPLATTATPRRPLRVHAHGTTFVLPVIDFAGTLRVDDAARVAATLHTGLGRHRHLGLGLLLTHAR